MLTMMCSFTADTDGYVYDLPDRVGCRETRRLPRSRRPRSVDRGVGRTDPAGRRRHARVDSPPVVPVPAALPDDPHLHTAFLGFASDWTGNGGRPLYLEGDITGMVSLDHAVWFHRPARADAWHFFDVHSLVNAGWARRCRRAMFDVDGRVVASVAQEMRLTPVEE